jgi:hypothetical protein
MGKTGTTSRTLIVVTSKLNAIGVVETEDGIGLSA